MSVLAQTIESWSEDGMCLVFRGLRWWCSFLAGGAKVADPTYCGRGVAISHGAV